MPKVIISGIPGLDGEYDFALTFTHRDFRTIKLLTGVRANEVEDALAAGDLDIIVAIAEIALQRNGVKHHVDQLWDAEAGAITMEFEEEEAEGEDADASPPLQQNSESASESANSESNSSGVNTRLVTELYPETSIQNDSGIPQRASS